jgi:type II secretory pathway pseudopilin PulG
MRTPPRERGVALVALVAALTIGLIALTVMLPAWKFIGKNEREKELLFRGDQLAKAIESFQRKNGNALPPSVEVLIKGRYLRRAYKDPMDAKGEWRLIRQGEPVNPICVGSLSTAPSPQPAPAVVGVVGAVVGVASRSKEKSLRTFNNCTRYDQWFFIAGQAREWDFMSGEPVRVPRSPIGPQARPNISPRP